MQPVWNLLNDPRRVAGICGVAFTILFLIAGPVLLGTAPTAGASAGEIREYFADTGSDYFLGDMLFSFAVVLFLLPFVVALRAILHPVDPSGGFWANLVLAGGLVGIILGGAGAQAISGVAIAGPAGLDDSTLMVAVTISQYSTSACALGLGVMMIGVAVVVAQTAILWRWLSVLAALSALMAIVGLAWIPAEDPDGLLAGLSIAGMAGAQLVVLLASVQMLLPASRSARQTTAALPPGNSASQP